MKTALVIAALVCGILALIPGVPGKDSLAGAGVALLAAALLV